MIRKLNAQIFLVEIGKVAPEILSHKHDVIVSTFGGRCVAGTLLPMPEYAYLPRRNNLLSYEVYLVCDDKHKTALVAHRPVVMLPVGYAAEVPRIRSRRSVNDLV